MGVVSVPSSAARSPLGLSMQFSTERVRFKRSTVVAFKEDKPQKVALVALEPHEQIPLPIETPKRQQKRRGRATKGSKRVKAVSVEASPYTSEVDYNEAAAKLENIYKLSPTIDTSEDEAIDGAAMRRRLRRQRKVNGDDSESEKRTTDTVVRNRAKKVKRLGLDERIALRKKEEKKFDTTLTLKNREPKDENEKIKKLLWEYGAPTFNSLDWKKAKIPPVLGSSEHTWLFNLMQPMKAHFKVQEDLQKKLDREPTNFELAYKLNMKVSELRKQIQIGQAARNKLIQHNLRLVLFVMNKYFRECSNHNNFEDLCQAGMQGLITSIDRFDPKKKFRLSTYAFFWIRHGIIRYITNSSFFRIPYNLEMVRAQIQKVKRQLCYKLSRSPTDEEIREEIGISREKYNKVLRASNPIYSLHAKNPITQEELINEIIDEESDTDRVPLARLRLALDDVLDSLKPKESLVIRQRYGLDGKGGRSLGEIAGNLNISREMVRKYEMKAMMKLKHPMRIDYLREYL
uniref:Sigma factor n=1 Tax=Pelargonium transvaalense TaxID=158603 RepID=A0A0G2SWX8_9ROSI|nr:sigma factor [Pelargonium transvaalense]